MRRTSRLIAPVLVLLLGLIVAGCSSTTSQTSGYFGPSVESVTEKKKAATQELKDTKKELRKLRRQLNKLEKLEARDERRLKRKRLSKRSKAKIEARMAKRAPQIEDLQDGVKKAQKAFDRAVRNERRAQRRLESAQKRKEAADRRIAAAKKRKEERLAAAEKKKKEREAAKIAAAKAKKANGSSSTSAFGGGLFARKDPALKYIDDYKGRQDGEFALAAIPTDKIDKRLLRQQVRYRTRYPAGTLVVDTKAKYLYLVQYGGRAMRYGIGVGKAGFEWSGAARVGWKREWPTWTPPSEMIARKPRLRKWSAANGGMPGGPKNPLGARALYLTQGGVDTLYRLHGTPEWKSIGTAASSGCIRLMNQDVIDLFKRVPNGAKVVVL